MVIKGSIERQKVVNSSAGTRISVVEEESIRLFDTILTKEIDLISHSNQEGKVINTKQLECYSRGKEITDCWRPSHHLGDDDNQSLTSNHGDFEVEV